MKTILLSSLLLLCACEEASEHSQSTEAQQISVQDQTGESRIATAQADQSCLKTCGMEARSGVYSDCLGEGGEQRECGANARVWYRECIESRCTDADITLDDCRTDCRQSYKPAYEQCVADTEDETTCQTTTRANVKECVAECN